MTSDWSPIELGEVILDIAAGPFGSNLKTSCFVPDGFPIIDGANLKGFRLTDNVTKFVTLEKASSLKRSIAHRGDVVVTISGTIGQIAFIPPTSRYEAYLCSQRQFRATFDTARVSVPYLVYYFHSYEGSNKILAFANQVGVPALSQPLKNFREIKMLLPPLATQRRIAAVLSALDDKIELNNRINANLEAQAQALFRSWFVDFEPWGGTMPEGWRGDSLGKVFDFQRGKAISKNSVVQSPNIQHKYVVYGAGKEIFGYSENYFLSQPSVLIVAIGAGAGMVSRSYEQHYSVTSNAFYVLPRDASFFPYAYLFLKQFDFVSFCSGSAQPMLAYGAFAEETMTIPDNAVLRSFCDMCWPIIRAMDVRQRENKILAEFRDTLLPKLMSGEIDVSQVEVPA